MSISSTDIAIGSIGLLAILAVILTIVYTIKSYNKSKETFVVAGEGTHVTPQGAITGPGIFTNQLVKGDASNILETVNKDGKVTDTSCMLLGARGNSSAFDDAFQKQLKVQEIQDRSNNGFQTVEDLKEISKNIAQDNSVKGMFQRDGMASTKLVIDKYSTVGVIDEKYVPNRDRPKELRMVGTAIMMPGFAFDATKALDSNGTGICPTGGVPGVGLQRHKHKTTSLKTVSEGTTEAPVQDATQELLQSNNVMGATTISTTEQSPKVEIVDEADEDIIVDA